jgi:hypothetical protein
VYGTIRNLTGTASHFHQHLDGGGVMMNKTG